MNDQTKLTTAQQLLVAQHEIVRLELHLERVKTILADNAYKRAKDLRGALRVALAIAGIEQ